MSFVMMVVISHATSFFMRVEEKRGRQQQEYFGIEPVEVLHLPFTPKASTKLTLFSNVKANPFFFQEPKAFK